MKLKLSLLAATLPLCLHLSAQTYINNQIGTSAQSPGTFWIAGEGRSSAQFKVQKDGSNSVSSSFQLFNAAGTRGANLQLSGEGTPGLSTWLHDGSSWVERMRVRSDGTTYLFSTAHEAVRMISNNAYISGYDATNTTRSGYLQFNAATNSTLMVGIAQGLAIGTSNTVRTYITAAGSIGINTTSPQFHIHQVGSNTSNFALQNTTPLGVSSGAFARFYNSGTPTAADQRLGGVLWGTNPTGATFRTGAQINVCSEAAWVDGTSQPTYISFATVASGSVAQGERMRITAGGNIGIGTSNPGNYKLAVEGTVGARKVKVTQASWADFVFDPEYRLPSLHEVEQFVKTHRHLPDIPTAKEIATEGLDLAEMDKKLL